MSMAGEWDAVPLAQRQARIRRFLQTQDVALANEFISLVRAPHGMGVYASAGPNYQFAVFGRDSLAVAEDLLAQYPDLVREIILFLAHLQGMVIDSQREEEPGKIHHEYRSKNWEGVHISVAAAKVLDELGPRWGGDKQEMRYYGSIDATPKFIGVVGQFVANYGRDILQVQVTSYTGQIQILERHVRMAVDWLVGKVQASPWQLLEFKRLNPQGLPYQGWRDSDKAYLHADGASANADGGVASIEVQGYAYDALCAAVELWPEAAEVGTWRALAQTIRQQTLELFWMEADGYFAQALDRDSQGQRRQVATLTSSPGVLLASKLLDSDEHTDCQPYVAAVASMIMGKEFLTDAGVRLRAARHGHLVDFAAYHGSWVVWPYDTHQVARGLRRHGYGGEAMALEAAMKHAVSEAGEFYEFFLVDLQGTVQYHYRHASQPMLHIAGRANRPEPGQAWTISAILSLGVQ